MWGPSRGTRYIRRAIPDAISRGTASQAAKETSGAVDGQHIGPDSAAGGHKTIAGDEDAERRKRRCNDCREGYC